MGDIINYSSFKNDPYGLETFSFANGLTLFLCNKKTERTEARIVVNVGSLDEQQGETGLAHLLEHMMFKGSEKIGTLSVPQEQKLLQESKQLLEQYLQSDDDKLQQQLRQKIRQNILDSSELIIPDELNRLYSQMGARELNASTSYNETCYKLNLPNDKIALWLELELERFRQPCFRQFLTELMVVYEEYNQDIDDDYSLAFDALLQHIQINNGSVRHLHPIIGFPQDLKSPSLTKLEKFYHRYYQPSNMGIFLCGDFNSLDVVEIVKESWGQWHSDTFSFTPADVNNAAKIPLHARKRTAPIAEFKQYKQLIQHGTDPRFLFKMTVIPHQDVETKALFILLDDILNDEQAGLFEQKIIYNNKLLEAESWSLTLPQCIVFFLYAEPILSLSLQETESLVDQTLLNLFQGTLSDTLFYGIKTKRAFDRLQALEGNNAIDLFVNAFAEQESWQQVLERDAFLDTLDKATFLAKLKEIIVNKHWISVHKEQGINSNIPALQPFIDTQAYFPGAGKQSQQSLLWQQKLKQCPPPTQIQEIKNNIIYQSDTQSFTANTENSLFQISCYYPIGHHQLPMLSIVAYLLPWFSTKSTPGFNFKEQQLSKGLSIDLHVEKYHSFLQIEGNSQNCSQQKLQQELAWLLQLLKTPYIEEKILKKALANLVQKREESSLSRQDIGKRLYYLNLYGTSAQGSLVLSNKKLLKINEKVIFKTLKKLAHIPQTRVHLFAPPSLESYLPMIASSFYDKNKKLVLRRQKLLIPQKNHISFAHYDMNQIDIEVLMPLCKIEKSQLIYLLFFNEYMGAGLNSIVFTELRERKGLCYSAGFMLNLPHELHAPIHLNAYASIQPQKLEEVLNILLQWCQDLPYDEVLFNCTKTSLLYKITSKNIINRHLYEYSINLKHLGITHQDNSSFLEQLQSLTFQDLQHFHHSLLRGKFAHINLVGNEKLIDFPLLNQFGSLSHLPIKKLYPWNSP